MPNEKKMPMKGVNRPNETNDPNANMFKQEFIHSECIDRKAALSNANRMEKIMDSEWNSNTSIINDHKSLTLNDTIQLSSNYTALLNG